MEPSLDVTREAEWRAHAEGARRLAHALVYDRDRADDVAQEAVRIALERGPGDGRPVRAWLAGIVRNVARNVVRGDRHRREREHAAARPEALEPTAAWAERLAEQRRVIDAVLRLDEPCRSTVILRYFEDLGPRAIARRLEVPEETVRTRLRRGRERLRAALDEQHGGDRAAWAVALLPLGDLGRSPNPLPWITGGLAVKKVSLGFAALVLCTLGGWWLLERGEREDRDAGQADLTALAPPAPPASDRPVLVSDGSRTHRAQPAPPPVDFATIDRDRDLHGVVVDREGRSVSRARVRAFTRVVRPRSANTIGISQGEDVQGETVTSSDGSFAVRLGRGASTNLRVEASGFGTHEGTFAAAGGRVHVVLGPAVRLVVDVRDEQGLPVADAKLWFFQGGSFMVGLPRVPYAFSWEGVSDAAGRWVAEALPAEVWGRLDVTHPKFGSPGWMRVTLPAQGERTETLVLLTGRTLRGRVLTADSGKPIAGAGVGEDWWRRRHVLTDKEGAFVLEGWIGKDFHQLFASAPGRLLQGITVGEQDTFEFRLVAGRTAQGRVVDRAGAPVVGATVRAKTQEDPNGAYAGDVATGPDGRFAFEGLRPDATYTFAAFAAGHGAGDRVVAPPADEAETLEVGDIFLAVARSVRGRVVDTEGRPVEGLEVLLDRNREWRVTDDLGRFHITPVADGQYELRISGAGRESITRNLRVSGSDVAGLEAVVASGRTLEVFVGPADAPPEGFTVEVVGSDGVARRSYPDDRGRTVFVVPDGAARARVAGVPPGWLSPGNRETLVAADQTSVRLPLARGESISGVVRRRDGQPLAGAMVLLRPSEAGGACLADVHGAFRATVHPGSVCDLVFEGDVVKGGQTALYGIVRGVRAGATGVVLEVEEVAKDRTLTVLVRDPEGAPVKGAAVFFGVTSTKADAAGRAELTGLPARPLLITAVHDAVAGWMNARLEDVIPAGQEVVLDFRRGVKVEGRIVGRAGKGAVASLEARQGDSTVGWGRSGPDGKFVLTLDPDAQFPLTVRARFSGERTREVSVDLERMPATPLEIAAPGP